MWEIIILFCFCLILLVAQYIHFQKYIRTLNKRHSEAMELMVKGFQDATKDQQRRQRSVIKGHLSEQLFPIKNSNFISSDMRFIGNPIDYIVFNGYTGAKDDGELDEAIEIVFLDVKTGKSRLSKHQHLIAEAVKNKRVRWETVIVE